MGDLLVEQLRVGIPNTGTSLLRDVSFALPAGHSKALIGRSGSGKSLIASSLIRLLRPPLAVQGGQVLLNGTDLLSLDSESMQNRRGRGIWLLFQGAGSLSPCLTVGDQVSRAAARKFRVDEKRIAAGALDAVGLSRYARHYPFELSGGMRQRVLIAMAFALQPEVLIADEPTTGLDPCTQAEILANLQTFVSQCGASLLLITHDLRAAGTLCREAIVLHSGTVVAEGTWDELAADAAASQAILDAARKVES